MMNREEGADIEEMEADDTPMDLSSRHKLTQDIPMDVITDGNVVIEELGDSVREEALDLSVRAFYAPRPFRRLNRVERQEFGDPRCTLPNSYLGRRDAQTQTDDGTCPPATRPDLEGVTEIKREGLVPPQADTDKQAAYLPLAREQATVSEDWADSHIESVQPASEKGGVSLEIANVWPIVEDRNSFPPSRLAQNVIASQLVQEEELGNMEVEKCDKEKEVCLAKEVIRDRDLPTADFQEESLEGVSGKIGTLENAATVSVQDGLNMDIACPSHAPLSYINISENVSGSLEGPGRGVLEGGRSLEEHSAITARADKDNDGVNSMLHIAQAMNPANIAAFPEHNEQGFVESIGHLEDTVEVHLETGRAMPDPISNLETAHVSPADSNATSKNSNKRVTEKKGEKRKDRSSKKKEKANKDNNTVQPTSSLNDGLASFWFDGEYYKNESQLLKHQRPYVKLDRVSPPKADYKVASKKAPKVASLTDQERFDRIKPTVSSIVNERRCSVTNLDQQRVPNDGSLANKRQSDFSQKVSSEVPKKTSESLLPPATKKNHLPSKMLKDTSKITLSDIDWTKGDNGRFELNKKMDWQGMRIPKIPPRKTILTSPHWLKPKKSPKRSRKNKHQNLAVAVTPMCSPSIGWKVASEISEAHEGGGGDATLPHGASVASGCNNDADPVEPKAVELTQIVLQVARSIKCLKDKEKEAFVADAEEPDVVNKVEINTSREENPLTNLLLQECSAYVAPAVDSGGNPFPQSLLHETGDSLVTDVGSNVPLERMAEASPPVDKSLQLQNKSNVKNARKRGTAFGWKLDLKQSVEREEVNERDTSPPLFDEPLNERLQILAPALTENQFESSNDPVIEYEKKRKELENVIPGKRSRPLKQKAEENHSNKTCKRGFKKQGGSPKTKRKKETTFKNQRSKQFTRNDHLDRHVGLYHNDNDKHFFYVCVHCCFRTVNFDEIYLHIWKCETRPDPDLPAKVRVEHK